MSKQIDFNPTLLETLLPRVIEISRLAGEKTIEHRPMAAATAEAKGDGSPVTLADRASHDYIMEKLAELEPVLDVISEEGDLSGVESGVYDQFWLVDPLDGTGEFVAGRDEFTVNIALVENGEPILGVVVAPVSDATYFGARGLGAWKQEQGGKAIRISCDNSREGITAVVSRSHGSQRTEDYLARLGSTDTVRSGSSIKICLVAEGTADIYPRLGRTSIWDTAAGVAVAREAGCEVTDLDGKRLGFDPAGGIIQYGFIVARPELLQKALEALE